jgi:hypothetical protein
MGVPVILGVKVAVKVHMAPAVVMMGMEMPPFANQFHAEETAEDDEHDTDDAFCRQRERLWDRDAKDQNNRPDQEQDDGMADSPAQAHKARGAPRRPLGKHRRNRGKMIRI